MHSILYNTHLRDKHAGYHTAQPSAFTSILPVSALTIKIDIQKDFPLSPQQLSKITETSRVFKTVFPYDKLEILLIHPHDHTNTIKNMTVFSSSL